MPNYNDEIKNFVVGDSLDVLRSVSGLPAGQFVTQAWLTIKVNPNDDDINAVVQKIITTTFTSNGQILDDGTTSHNGVFLFQLTPAETSLFVPLFRYAFDVQIQFDSGKITTPYSGTLIGKRQVTKAIA